MFDGSIPKARLAAARRTQIQVTRKAGLTKHQRVVGSGGAVFRGAAQAGAAASLASCMAHAQRHVPVQAAPVERVRREGFFDVRSGSLAAAPAQIGWE